VVKGLALYVGDFNGDGMADVLLWAPQKGDYVRGYSDGLGSFGYYWLVRSNSVLVRCAAWR